MRDLDFHRRLAEHYLSAPAVQLGDGSKAAARLAKSYDALKSDILWQFGQLPVNVQWLKAADSPYADCDALFADLDYLLDNGGRLAQGLGVSISNGPPAGHPLAVSLGFNDSRITWNCLLRAVHDYYGHYGGRHAEHFRFEAADVFGLHGEESAYLRHREMFSPAAIEALTLETRCQTAANNLVNPSGFCEQRIVSLPSWTFQLED